MIPTSYITEEGDEVQLPTKWAICDRCHGEGHHGNPAFDGTTTEWWFEGDPSGEQLDDYMSGRWDVRCEADCDHGKIKVVDEERLSEDTLALYHRHLQDLYEDAQVSRMERMMGA